MITVRRFGWSSTSQHDADVHARSRLEEALAVVREGGPEALRTFARRERKVAYAGADGLPIREEIVEEHPDLDTVITRNVYGALCLNTTVAMFVDSDATASRANAVGCATGLAGAAVGAVLAKTVLDVHLLLAVAAGVVAFAVVGTLVWRLVERRRLRFRDLVAWVIQETRTWCANQPDWAVAVYRTPGGVRLLPIHAAFDAGDASTYEFMRAVGVDALYERMCRIQKCFRARVSPKPWSVGVERFPAGGTWPVVDPDKLAARAEWVRGYARASRGFAACRFVEIVGSGRPDPRVESIRRLHDDLAGAHSDLPLA